MFVERLFKFSLLMGTNPNFVCRQLSIPLRPLSAQSSSQHRFWGDSSLSSVIVFSIQAESRCTDIFVGFASGNVVLSNVSQKMSTAHTDWHRSCKIVPPPPPHIVQTLRRRLREGLDSASPTSGPSFTRRTSDASPRVGTPPLLRSPPLRSTSSP